MWLSLLSFFPLVICLIVLGKVTLKYANRMGVPPSRRAAWLASSLVLWVIGMGACRGLAIILHPEQKMMPALPDGPLNIVVPMAIVLCVAVLGLGVGATACLLARRFGRSNTNKE